MVYMFSDQFHELFPKKIFSADFRPKFGRKSMTLVKNTPKMAIFHEGDKVQGMFCNLSCKIMIYSFK